MRNEEIFRSLCYYGQSDNKIDIHINNDAFKIASENGYLNIVKWLYEISTKNNNKNNKIDIHIDNEYAFRNACKNGHLNVAEWLYNLSKIDGNSKINIHMVNEYAFIYSCYHGYTNIQILLNGYIIYPLKIIWIIIILKLIFV